MKNTSTLLHFYTAILLAVLASTASAAFYIPETSWRTMQTSPLKPGEAAYIAEPRGTATLYIGGDTGGVYRVSEPSTIIGNRIEMVPDDELAVVTQNAVWTNGAWYVFGAGTTGTVAFVTRGGEDILDFDFGSTGAPAGISPETGHIFPYCDGPQLKIEIVVGEGGWTCVSNVVCVRRAIGDKEVINDLRTTQYIFEDELGIWELGDLRSWAKTLYNGNRGEDWSSYPARKPTNMDGQPLMFAGNRRYQVYQDADTNLVVNAGGRHAITVAFHGASFAPGAFRCTSFARTNNVVYIGYTIDADNFDPAEVGVQTCATLNGVWDTMAAGTYTATADTVTIPNQSGTAGFYRLIYGDTTSNTLDIRLAGNVIIEDALILKGTDNKYYQITVGAGGVISATEVTP